MIRFIINILIFLLIFINNTNANKISIKFKVENEIITSQDVNNELIYLRLLNNKLNNLDKKNQEQIAVNSLIQEKIKFIELQNYFDFSIKDDQMEKLINKTLTAIDAGFEKLSKMVKKDTPKKAEEKE